MLKINLKKQKQQQKTSPSVQNKLL